jgi:multiple sugar transport system permease protein
MSLASNPTQGMSNERRRNIASLLFVLPAAVLVLLLVAYPLLRVVWDSFQNVNLVNPSVIGFAGLENYRFVLDDEEFMPSVWRTLWWTVFSVAGEYILGMASALALAQKVKGRAFFRAVITIPWIIPIAVAGLTWTWMLTPDYGVVNAWLIKTGILDHQYYWLGRENTALASVIFVNIWRSFPFYTISLLASLMSIPKDLYEAAAVDGAGAVRCFISITLPHLRTISITLVFIHLIWTAINFDFIYVMTEGGPLNSTQTLPLLIYHYAMKTFDVGAASVVATLMLLFMISMVVALRIVTGFFRRKGM